MGAKATYNFDKDFNDAFVKYPRLKEVDLEGTRCMTGWIDLIHPILGKFDEYRVLIKYIDEFPYRFPTVYELDGKIPRDIEYNRHIYTDTKSLCFGVLPEQLIVCRNTMPTVKFIDEILVPHLARETLRNNGEPYPDGGRSHGIKGTWEFFEEKLNISEPTIILEILEKIASRSLPSRNDPCICGSIKKYKNCHINGISYLSSIEPRYLREIIVKMKEKDQS
jgi:hypothetical protein